MTSILAALQAQRADFYPVMLHLQDMPLKKKKEKSNSHHRAGLQIMKQPRILLYICHSGSQQGQDQTQRACTKHASRPHKPVKLRFSIDVVKQQIKDVFWIQLYSMLSNQQWKSGAFFSRWQVIPAQLLTSPSELYVSLLVLNASVLRNFF